jgi:predicted HAD superfamily phosphohydrolase YqeG
MLNSTGAKTENFANQNQILANTEHQYSVSCIVNASVGVTVDSRKIAKAGTPINMNLQNTQTPVTLATASVAMVGVLLHDVDVTGGNNNGTALIFGFVNLNRLETDVATKVTTALVNVNASKQVTFMKV